jgi:hypothetical protein
MRGVSAVGYMRLLCRITVYLLPPEYRHPEPPYALDPTGRPALNSLVASHSTRPRGRR